MLYKRVIVIALASVLGTTLSNAGDRVVVESKAVPPGAESVALGVYIANDSALRGIVIPLEFHELVGGAYIADTFAVTLQGRFTGWDYGDSSYSMKMLFPSRTPPGYSNPYGCYLDSTENVWQEVADSLDFVSPDAFAYMAVAWEKDSLPAGDDGVPGNGTPSMVLTFNVLDDTGRFEVDQTCTWPRNELLYSFPGGGTSPSIDFTAGVVEVIDSCACECHADPICDSVHNVLDLVAIVGVAYYGGDSIPDPNLFCPYETTDVNCDDVTDVLDVGLMNQVVNYGANPDSTFCDPCGP